VATIGLSEASRLTGKPRSTIHRAMASGRLSYTLGADGARLIDPAELGRVWPATPQRNTDATDAWDNSQHAAHRPVSGEIRELRARLADMERVNEDLRRRLDKSEDERRATSERLTAILADQRETPAKPRRWWQFGR
jgi:hypothetical protein